MATVAFDSFAGNASDAVTRIITQSKAAEDAFRSIGRTVLKRVINTFVQMGIDWPKSAIFGATTQQAAIAIPTTLIVFI
ncbi:Uncharacterised protein [Yersinia thracica]|uniref:Uncharacterized protein n=1 Tax=Yersinia thracica TaxID=2890319 RepID=A0A0T9R1A7_9GAMM|nr:MULTISPECIES: hypothetical protein [Yersinia]ATM88541.1 hypothetical protein CRN74_22285 [Yersinia frederiksenii]EKN4770868.1 hypothetical protein [Yersinia enterocolitica]MDA5531054.1 hypothetical protein [Yersinia enterocolitica]CNH27985.1 Uncharacterised protein [Yersinia pseudotuberculosis]CNI38581.1 Uncharacterised protein [Yersinia thracica]